MSVALLSPIRRYVSSGRRGLFVDDQEERPAQRQWQMGAAKIAGGFDPNGLETRFTLSLSGARVGSAGMEHLKGLSALGSLTPAGTQIDNAGLAWQEALMIQAPRVRFTLRQLMVAVAVLGVLFAAETLRRRHAFHRRLARFHTREWLKTTQLSHGDFAHERLKRRKNQYHFRLIFVHKQAAAKPWLLVAPDPPRPE
jgi:hypothetical protein